MYNPGIDVGKYNYIVSNSYTQHIFNRITGKDKIRHRTQHLGRLIKKVLCLKLKKS